MLEDPNQLVRVFQQHNEQQLRPWSVDNIVDDSILL
jgi:hypothetical protein